MEDHGVQLAAAKTEIVILTKRRIPSSITMMVGTQPVQTCSSGRYLGVMLDNRLTFWEHIRRVCNKAVQSTAALSRLMANMGGPKPWKRRLLLTSVQAALLYGEEIWADALRDLGQWSSRRHGEVTFYLTQFLTGHRYFRKYLFRMRKVGSPRYLLCGEAEDDVLHTFFVCDYFADVRGGVERAIADSITPENIVGVMLHSQERWDAVARYDEYIPRSASVKRAALRHSPREV
ncbi:uncharacterized protein LOC114882382 [Osmia bicornis bicornis]|uniref:uncharacterized protein LOC114882382 n=1 Tax=Osmia bicornis bicornis TaxID=1437191 RepID=UPI001EAF505C|nr:uncharacterized protein LOC114882382 [Osmia bicornis bicornis]